MKNLKIEDLSVEQKIGMLLCARSFKQEGDLEFTLELIRNHALGSVQISVKKPEIVKKVRETADYPILIIADMEMGFPGSELPPVSLMQLSACDKPEYFRAFARAVVADAKRAGFNGTWSPVIDVVGSSTNGASRRISDDPLRVAKGAAEIAQVYANNHFLSCGKHYPGGDHGLVDTHMANVPSDTSLEELKNVKFLPYRYLLERGLLPSIMVDHSTVTSVDPAYPSSLSKKVIDLIRDAGFDGVCFTDSFAMMAILQQFGEDKILGMAIAAGNDIVLPNYRTATKTSYEYLLQNYRDGAFTEERLDEAVRRVLEMQKMLGEAPEKPDLFTEKDRELYDRIPYDSITAVTDPGLSPALPAENKDRLFVVLTPMEGAGPQVESLYRTWYHPDAIIEKIHEEFPEAEVVTLPEFPMAKQNDAVLSAAVGHKEVTCVSFCTTAAYQGTDCMTRRAEALVNALIRSGKVSAVVHFGNPFAVRPLLHVPRLLFGYNCPESQPGAIEVLAGKRPAPGKLPFRIELP